VHWRASTSLACAYQLLLFPFSVWARSTTLTQCAYRRVQRKASHRVRIARLYGESVLTKSPLAVSVVNYVRTRDPEIRDNLVQQAKATATVCVSPLNKEWCGKWC
jgi:hypothetical protein